MQNKDWTDLFVVKYITHLKSGWYIVCLRSGVSQAHVYDTEDQAIRVMDKHWYKIIQNCPCKECSCQVAVEDVLLK